MPRPQPRTFFNPNAPDVVLRSLFLKYDKDGSGQLSRIELSALFQEDLGLTKEQAETYSHLLDRDGNGEVSFEEFKLWLQSGEKFSNIDDKSRYARLKKAVEMFKKFDVDNSQSLDSKEFKKLFIESGGKPNRVDDAHKELDKDGNGVISFQEFLIWLNWVPMDTFQ